VKKFVELALHPQQSGIARWIITASALGFALVFVLYAGHPEWLIRIAMLGVALLAFFFSSKEIVRSIICVLVLSLALVVIFYHLGDGSLYDWDEAIYAQIAKELTASDDWMTLTMAGIPFLHKPPLSMWLTALAYQVGGINEYTARFWSATFGFGVVALTLIFGWRLFSWAAGILAALLLLAVDHSYFSHWYNFISQARVGMLETMLTFWIMLSLILVWEAKDRPKLIIWIGTTTGLAVMTKSWPGFFALLLPLLYAMATREFYQQRRYWTLAALLAGAIILPWHLSQLYLYGTSFLHEYVVVNLLGRVSGLVEQDPRGVFFYVENLRRGFSSFAYLWPVAYFWAMWTARKKDGRQKLLLLTWITIPLFLFSMATTKLGWYTMLIYPGIALLLAHAAVELLGGRAAVATVGIAMALFYFRLPIASDGSPDAKRFAESVDRIVPAGERIYDYSDVNCATGTSISGHVYRGAQRLRPALLYYLHHPLVCTSGNPNASGLTNRGYLIVDTQSPGSPRSFNNVLVRGDPYVLIGPKTLTAFAP
jgi:4-amino-4-deoxy-L-arabinose transferase-like glycosyltransferase